jgi:hypothetical protein
MSKKAWFFYIITLLIFPFVSIYIILRHSNFNKSKKFFLISLAFISFLFFANRYIKNEELKNKGSATKTESNKETPTNKKKEKVVFERKDENVKAFYDEIYNFIEETKGVIIDINPQSNYLYCIVTINNESWYNSKEYEKVAFGNGMTKHIQGLVKKYELSEFKNTTIYYQDENGTDIATSKMDGTTKILK